MARGGKRAGAGRRQGSLTTRTREVAEKAIQEGTTPLEVMLAAMRFHVKAKDLDRAAAIAKDAAPYIHPKLAAVEMTGKDGAPLQAPTLEIVMVSPDERSEATD